MTSPMRKKLRAASQVSSLRYLTNFSAVKAQVQPIAQSATTYIPPSSATLPPNPGWSQRNLSRAFFDTTGKLWLGMGGEQPQDPNKAKLGKTLRILQERLPTLLQSPLPQEILAPNICLHLFPSTHPHLPTVSGRVAYNAALWTSPIAWNRVPIIGNVKLEILAERVTTEPLTFLPRQAGAIPDQLVVRWCEWRKDKNGKIGKAGPSPRDKEEGNSNTAFTGLFIFDFDQEGRVLTHTIEHAQGNSHWEKGVGAKFVGLTDWLLGGMKDTDDIPATMFEIARKEHHT